MSEAMVDRSAGGEATLLQSPRLLLLNLMQKVLAMVIGGEAAPGETCRECGLGPVGEVRDALILAAKGLEIPGPLGAEDVGPHGKLGVFGRAATLARMMANDGAFIRSYRVRSFHTRFGHPLRLKPTVPPDGEMRFRLKLITEEYLEMLEACGIDVDQPKSGSDTVLSFSVRKALDLLVEESPLRVDLPALEDAWQDLDFVVEGGRAICGIDAEPGAQEVYASNMSKEPVLGPDGKPDPLSKPTKPEGWAEPDMRRVLADQGFEG